MAGTWKNGAWMSFGSIWRWFLLLTVAAGSLWLYLLAEHDKAERQAILKATGFAAYADYQQASAAGITDPSAWQAHKAKLDQEAWARKAEADARRDREIDAKIKRDEAEMERTRDPGSRMLVKSLSWTKSGFGTVGLVTLAIENMNDFAVKDVVISCDFTGNSGTKLSSARNTLYETIKAKNSRTFKDFNIGFIHSQASRGGCSVESARKL